MPIVISDDLATGILQYLQKKGRHGRALGALMTLEATAPQRDAEIAERIRQAHQEGDDAAVARIAAMPAPTAPAPAGPIEDQDEFGKT